MGLSNILLGAGIALTVAAGSFLVGCYWRAHGRTAYPAYGWAGLVVMVAAEALLFWDVWPVPVYFTPLAWSGYIAAIDAAIYSIRERSLVRTEPEAFVWMAVLSIFLWLIFEGGNERLLGWTYVGLPGNIYLRYLGYGWAFATIIPAILETAEFLLATLFRNGQAPEIARIEPGGGFSLRVSAPRPEEKTAPAGWIGLGLVLLTVPMLLLPVEWGFYLSSVGLLGFIFLFDALNDRRSLPSIFRDLRHGYSQRLKALLVAGAVCGILWEFWNYWATAKWFYILPIAQEWALFEKPVLGYLGLPAFAVEMFALYTLAAGVLKKPLYEIR